MRSQFLKLLSFINTTCHALPYWTKSSEDGKISGGQKYHQIEFLIYTLLKIAATISVTSCECERSGSFLKRLKTYLCASMGLERLTSLAIIHINYDQKIDKEKGLQIFCKK